MPVSVRKILFPIKRLSYPRGTWKKSMPIRPCQAPMTKRSRNLQWSEATIAAVQATAAVANRMAGHTAAFFGGFVLC